MTTVTSNKAKQFGGFLIIRGLGVTLDIALFLDKGVSITLKCNQITYVYNTFPPKLDT